MAKDFEPVAGAAALADTLLLCLGAGVLNASLITMMSSADAFAARLANATHQSHALSAAQLQHFSSSLNDHGAARAIASSDRMVATSDMEAFRAGAAAAQHGMPVVT